MKQLHVEENLELYYDEATRILHCKWIGLQNLDGIKRGGDLIMAHVKEGTIEKILNDNTQVTGPWYDATDWTRDVWFPAIIEAGLKWFAWVVPSGFFPRMSAARAMPDTPVIKMFTSSDEARSWLENPT